MDILQMDNFHRKENVKNIVTYYMIKKLNSGNSLNPGYFSFCQWDKNVLYGPVNRRGG